VIRVLLAEDQAMIREALAALLSFEDDIEVVAQVGRGDEVTAAARDAKPDVALLDIEMPGLDGLSAAAALRAACPDVKIIILTTFGRPGYLRRAMESGASGFIVKDSPADKLARTIRGVLAGQRVIDPDLAATALAEGANPLTPRERDVLAAAARNDGATLAQIAAAVYLSEGTVRNYLSSCIQKTGARNRAEAVRVAQDRGWLLSPGGTTPRTPRCPRGRPGSQEPRSYPGHPRGQGPRSIRWLKCLSFASCAGHRMTGWQPLAISAFRTSTMTCSPSSPTMTSGSPPRTAAAPGG
jgi:two-component system response regulator DesR